MKLFRYPVLLILSLSWLALVGADPREQAIAKAGAHVQPAPEHLLSALCFVVIGFEGNLPLMQAGEVPPPKNGTGIAIPVDADGYFLTAAHSVRPDQPMYVMGIFRGEMKALNAEIVYRGDPAQVESDFAILKVEELLPHVVPFVASLPREGEVLFAAGRLGSTTTLAEGLCCTAPAQNTPPQNTWLAHDIPAISGDSGGPLLSPDFKLVGLTSRGMRSWGRLRTAACCPSPQFVQQTIARRKTKQPDKVVQP